jgi:RimJ/RimL family protein N-acetyltransferase
LLHADDEVGQWIFSRTPNPQAWSPGFGTAIGFTEGAQLIAGVAYFLYNGANVFMAVAAENHRWITRDNLYRLSEYPFGQLQVKRVSALIDADNMRSRRFVEHLGYKHEATLAHAAPTGDQILYRGLREDCRWFAPRARKRISQPTVLRLRA